MEFYRIPSFQKDVLKLNKKYRSTESDILKLINIFREKGIPNYAIQYPGVNDDKCWKIKVI